MAYKLLLIEDDVNCANLVCRMLGYHDIEVRHVTSGLVGIQAAREFTPDAILVDINLPDIDGKVVALQLRKSPRWQHTPIIAFTANGTEKMKRLAINFGCSDLIAKPFETTAFTEKILQTLANLPTNLNGKKTLLS
jgi:two-component system, chemotaxis family, CheB/CheR fusion protein